MCKTGSSLSGMTDMAPQKLDSLFTLEFAYVPSGLHTYHVSSGVSTHESANQRKNFFLELISGPHSISSEVSEHNWCLRSSRYVISPTEQRGLASTELNPVLEGALHGAIPPLEAALFASEWLHRHFSLLEELAIFFRQNEFSVAPIPEALGLKEWVYSKGGILDIRGLEVSKLPVFSK